MCGAGSMRSSDRNKNKAGVKATGKEHKFKLGPLHEWKIGAVIEKFEIAPKKVFRTEAEVPRS